MQYTSCVPRLANDQFVTIRASYVKICNGNTVAAALISFFETWHNYKLKQIAEWKDVPGDKSGPNTWQNHTGKELEKGILGLGKRHSIDQAKEQLVQMGIIVIGRNPSYKFAFDATLHYQFQPDVVGTLLAFVENSKTGPFVEIDTTQDAEISEPGIAEISTSSLTNPTDESTNDTSPAHARSDKDHPGGKKTGGKKKRPAAAEVDKDWQRWVDAWFNFYQGRHDQMKPMFNDVQAQALKKLRQHLCDVAAKAEDQSADDSGYRAWFYILENWDKLDDWQRTQFDLTVVLKKINDILNRLKNGTQTNRASHSNGAKVGTSQQRIDAIKNY